MNKTVHSMGNMLRPGWDVGNLPFVYTIQAQRGNDGLPELMPFRLSIDPRFNLFIQSYNSTTEENLAHAYTKGSALSGLMDDTGNGYQYATDFQRFINERISVRGCRILDIGCEPAT